MPPTSQRPRATTFAIALSLLCLVLLPSPLPAAKPVCVTVFATGDLHEATANLPRIAQIVRDRKARDPNVLFLDAGDWFNRGDLPIMATQGQAMIELMAAAGYDGAILGNHELTFGTPRLVSLLDRYRLPTLGANAHWPPNLQPEHFAPYRIFKLNGATVAVIGAFTQFNNHDVDGLLKTSEVLKAVKPIFPQLRQQADLVVLVTHMGTPFDHLYANALPGLDLIVGAHDHSVTPALTLIGPEKRTVLLHTGWLGEHVGEAVFRLDGRKIIDRQSRLTRLTPDMPQDPAVKAVRDRYFAALPPDKPLATLAQPVTPEQLTARLARAIQARTGAHLVVTSSPLSSAPLPAGPLTPRALLAAVFRLDVVTFTVPNQASLDKLLAAARARGRTPTLHGAPPAPGVPILVAWPAVGAALPLNAPSLGLTAPDVSNLQRHTSWSLWQAALECFGWHAPAPNTQPARQSTPAASR